MATSRQVPTAERQWLRVLGTLNEMQARLFVAQRALEEGRGSVSRLARLTGMSRPTILKGIADLQGKVLEVGAKPFLFSIKIPGPFWPSAAKIQIGGGGGSRTPVLRYRRATC